MGVKKETQLQIRIQKYLMHRGAYTNKNWGSMVCKPGIADLTACYNGIYLAIEVKEGNNTPSAAQGIQCRKVWKSGGISFIAYNIETVENVLNIIDLYIEHKLDTTTLISSVHNYIITNNIDDGTRW